MIILIQTLLFVLFVTSVVFFILLSVAKWRIHKKSDSLGNYKDGWNDGYPPDHIPRSWITEGMRLDPKDGHNIIPTWKFNGKYYSWLAREK